ncbi:Fmt Methionyl-tRNA formyltransferase [Microbacteriaceae bacterium]
MRIIFAGTPANAAKTLEALLEANHEVVGVLTRIDAPTGRSGTLTESDVALVASEHGLPLHKSNLPDSRTSEWLAGLEPDLGIIVAYGSILKRNLLEIPAHGWLNVHYSLLPKHPGASPVQQALLEGESTTGVTVFQLDEGVDSGPIVAQATVEIAPDATAGSVLEGLTLVGSDLLIDTLANLESHLGAKITQDRVSKHPVTRKISRAMAKIEFGTPASKIVNLVRAMNPEPVAWFEFESQPIRVLESAISEIAGLPVGVASLVEGELLVGSLDMAVVLRTVQPAGKKPMAGADWFRGLRRDSLTLT